jgi:hypothetical protein
MVVHIDICSIAFSADACVPGIKNARARADERHMGGESNFRHGCTFCGWTRESATPVMLSPACERCGCALDAQPFVAVAPVTPAWTPPALLVLVLRRVGVLLGALALYAAAKLGYHAGGPSGAMIAFGVGAFLMLPFVPEQVGAAATSR